MAAQSRSTPDDLQPSAVPELADRAQQLLQVAGEWLFGPAMANLLAEFDLQLPAEQAYQDDPFAPLADRADWLHHEEKLPDWLVARSAVGGPSDPAGLLARIGRACALERLATVEFHNRGDGQVYQERWEGDRSDLAEPLRTRVIGLAERLGLVTAKEPADQHYDHTLILGGGGQSPLLRARLCAQLIDRGIEVGRLALLGSPRPIKKKERPKTRKYAPRAVDEFALMIAAAGHEFRLSPKPVRFLCGRHGARRICPSWAARFPGHPKTKPGYTHEREVDLVDAAGRVGATALSASTGQAPERPNTSDTFRLWARWARARPAQRVLIVTSQLFIPFQTFDALRLIYLPLAVEIDATGFDASWAGDPLNAADLLQEVLSGIRSARRLVVEACYVLLEDRLAGSA